MREAYDYVVGRVGESMAVVAEEDRRVWLADLERRGLW